KMSKSLGNYVGVTEPPGEQFGKIMSIPDDAMPMYVRYATGWDPERIDELVGALERGDVHPNAAKRTIGRAVAGLCRGAGAGAAAEAEFDRVFKRDEMPETMPEFSLAPDVTYVDALVSCDLAPSKREARRAIDQGGVRCDGTV